MNKMTTENKPKDKSREELTAAYIAARNSQGAGRDDAMRASCDAIMESLYGNKDSNNERDK